MQTEATNDKRRCALRTKHRVVQLFMPLSSFLRFVLSRLSGTAWRSGVSIRFYHPNNCVAKVSWVRGACSVPENLCTRLLPLPLLSFLRARHRWRHRTNQYQDWKNWIAGSQAGVKCFVNTLEMWCAQRPPLGMSAERAAVLGIFPTSPEKSGWCLEFSPVIISYASVPFAYN